MIPMNLIILKTFHLFFGNVSVKSKSEVLIIVCLSPSYPAVNMKVRLSKPHSVHNVYYWDIYS